MTGIRKKEAGLGAGVLPGWFMALSWSVWAAIRRYHRLGGLGNKHLFLKILRIR